jgi:prepilin-type N-terminal cleavage/methylation domain-containing protein
MRRLQDLWKNHGDDRGFTLVEVLVTTAIMAVVMVLVTGGVLLASGTSARVEAAGGAQQQVHVAFDNLDRQVRWAQAFSQPGTVGTATYVEWLYTATGAPTCNQLELDTTTQKLVQRSWPQGSPSLATTWKVLASRVTTAKGASAPFTLLTPSGSFTRSRLQIQVTSSAGGAKLVDAVTHDVTYTALNYDGASAKPTVCREGRSFP